MHVLRKIAARVGLLPQKATIAKARPKVSLSYRIFRAATGKWEDRVEVK